MTRSLSWWMSCMAVEHHGVQPTSCMDDEPEPYRGVRPTPANSGWTLPRAALLEGGVIECHQCLDLSLGKCSGISRHAINRSWLSPSCLPCTTSLPALTQPTIATTTRHQLCVACPPSTHSSSASESHHQTSVVTRQQQ